MPALERFNGVRVHVPLQLPGLIALLPDHALQRFQRRGLAVFSDPAQQDLDDPLDVGVRFVAVAAHGSQLLRHIGAFGMLTDKRRQVFGGIGEQHVEHKTHRAGGAFDVGENRFDRHRLSPPDAGIGWRCLRR
ncbi:hypothetical protein D9M71_285380 [compost metagenome]